MRRKSIKKEVNKRFVAAFEELERTSQVTTRSEAAKVLGILPQRLNEILQGRMNVGTDVLTNFFIRYKGNPDFIFLGTGTIFRYNVSTETPVDSQIVSEKDIPYAKPGKEGIRIVVKTAGEEMEERVLSVNEVRELLGIESLEKKLQKLLKDKKG